jgi:hypothetical protein
LPVALLGRPAGKVFPVQFLLDRSDPAHSQAVHDVTRDLDFYLIELGESWAYMQYHCGTMSNVYSTVHWSFFPATQQA